LGSEAVEILICDVGSCRLLLILSPQLPSSAVAVKTRSRVRRKFSPRTKEECTFKRGLSTPIKVKHETLRARKI
jgi:hypothetical protein